MGELEMTFSTGGSDTQDFDSATYLRMLVAIAKADKDNGPPEFAFVRRRALRFGLDYEHFLNTTDKDFMVQKQKVSRVTALSILRDAIALASMDRNFSLPEKQRIYDYAEKMDVTRSDVDALELIVKEYHALNDRWRRLVKSR